MQNLNDVFTSGINEFKKYLERQIRINAYRKTGASIYNGEVLKSFYKGQIS